MEVIQSLNFFRTIYMIQQSPYMLTDFIGIGDMSYSSSWYDSFDVIVNVNWNNERNVFRDKGKIVYDIGEKEDTLQIIPELVMLYQDNPHFRFLFSYNGNGVELAFSFLSKIS